MLHTRLSTQQQRVLVALLLALVAAAVWTAAFLRAGSAQAGPAGIDDRTALLTTNRAILKLCVSSSVAEVSNSALQATTRAALTRVAAHPRFAAVGLAAGGTPAVDMGCPGTARLAEPGFNPRLGLSDVGGIGVDQPSQYRTYVYVVPAEQLATLGGLGHQRVPQEVYCPPESPDSCAAVSTAVYLSPADIADMRKVAREIAGALGLNRNDVPTLP